MKFLISVLTAVFALPSGPTNKAGNNLPQPPSFAAATRGPAAISTFPSGPTQQSLVSSYISTISKDYVVAYTTNMTLFPDRYYQSQNGLKAAQWIAAKVEAFRPLLDPRVELTVSYFNHTWVQPSVIVRLAAKGVTGPGDIVITGTHFDTIANGKNLPNPAADDCASGSAVIQETLRVLITNKFIPKRPVEFHWYAAEEVGLYGSQAVAEDYAKRGVKVFTYLNLDQSGYVKKGTTPTIGIITDYVTTAATNFMRTTIKAYTTVTQTSDGRCGYRCTDNAAWYDHGYNSALAFESAFSNAFPYNDRVNSDGSPLDTISVLNFDHMLQFVRNTVGFLVELSLAP